MSRTFPFRVAREGALPTETMAVVSSPRALGGKHRLWSRETERTPEILETQEGGSPPRGQRECPPCDAAAVPSIVIHDAFRNIPQ